MKEPPCQAGNEGKRDKDEILYAETLRCPAIAVVICAVQRLLRRAMRQRLPDGILAENRINPKSGSRTRRERYPC